MRIHSMSLTLVLTLAGCVDDDDGLRAEGTAGAGGEAPATATSTQLAACIGLAEGAACTVGGAPSVCEIFANGLGCAAEDPGAGGAGGTPDAGGMPPVGGAGGAGGGQGMGGAGGMTPPDAAYAACDDAAMDDPCTFEGRAGAAIEGTCTILRGDARLVCEPSGMPPEGGMGGMGGVPPEGGVGGMGGVPPEGGMGGMGGVPGRPGVVACAELSPGDACSFERRDGGLVDGECRLDEDGTLLCRPRMMPEGGMGGMGGAPEGGMGGAPEGGMGGMGGAPEGGMGGAPDGGAGGMMPPPAAVDACADVANGEACMFETADGMQINGTCRETPTGDVACVP